MSAPAVSGAMAIVRQFFREGWHGRNHTPTAALLRALVVNSARDIGPPTAMGFGLPVLEEGLGLREHNLLIADNQTIRSQGHQIGQITVIQKSRVSISLTYLDPPLAADAISPLFADLDLMLIDTYGAVWLGNGREDSFATTEKVVIANAEPGTYSIHVIASEFPMDIPIPYAIVASGKLTRDYWFDMVEIDRCHFSCGRGSCSRALCQCGQNRIGVMCGHEVTTIKRLGPVRLSMGFKEIKYFKFKLNADSFSLASKTQEYQGVIVYCFGFDDKPFKISDPSAVCQRQKGYRADFNFTRKDHPRIAKGNVVYLVVYAVTGSELAFRFSIDNFVLSWAPWDLFLGLDQVWQIFIGAVLVFWFLVFLLILCLRRMMRRRRRHRHHAHDLDHKLIIEETPEADEPAKGDQASPEEPLLEHEVDPAWARSPIQEEGNQTL
jgi:hypothetical protein